jgi:hypothetical protein
MFRKVEIGASPASHARVAAVPLLLDLGLLLLGGKRPVRVARQEA